MFFNHEELDVLHRANTLLPVRRLIPLTTLVSAFALTACAPQPISETAFLDQAHRMASWEGVDDSTIVASARSICDTLALQVGHDSRTSVVRLYMSGTVDDEVSEAEEEAWLRLAVARFCPDMRFD